MLRNAIKMENLLSDTLDYGHIQRAYIQTEIAHDIVLFLLCIGELSFRVRRV